MGCRAEMLRWMWLAGLLVVSTPSHAETNAASPWRATGPGLAKPPLAVSTNALAPQPAATSKAGDADEFFAKYRQAVQEPFMASSPRLESTSRISETPPRYSALIKLPGCAELARLEENQAVQGFFIASIASGGAIVSTPTRVLVLVAPR